ncbi:hypothetical protein PXW85_27255, partial [Klebsiella pneumoniae]|nr:hypothetical protein [Klebsiella pneumoniae]
MVCFALAGVWVYYGIDGYVVKSVIDHTGPSNPLTKEVVREAEAFEDKFWSGIELSRLYQESQGRRDNLTGSEQIFYSGFK